MKRLVLMGVGAVLIQFLLTGAIFAVDAPTAFSGTYTSGKNVVRLSWTNPSGTYTGVRIVRRSGTWPTSETDGITVNLSSGTTSYSDTVSDGTYYYVIYGVNGSTFSSQLKVNFSDTEMSVVVDGVPGAVTGFNSSVSGDDVTLTWVAPGDADLDTFVICRSTTDYPSAYNFGDSVTYTGPAKTVTQLNLSDATYYYSIFAKDTAGHYSEKQTISAVVETSNPNAPTGFSATPVSGQHTVNLSWTGSSSLDVASVTILRKTGDTAPLLSEKGTFGVTTVVENLAFGTTTYTDTADDGRYSYSIFVKDRAGNMSELTSESKDEANVVNGPPEQLSGVLGYVKNGDELVLTWAAPSVDVAKIKILKSSTGFVTDVTNPGSLADEVVITDGSVSKSYSDQAVGFYYFTIFTADSDDHYGDPVKVALVVLPDLIDVKTFSGISDAMYGAMDSSGNMYVSNGTGKTVKKISADGRVLLGFGGSGVSDGKFGFAGSIAINQNTGVIYVVDKTNYRVQKFDLNGNFLTKFGSAGTSSGKFGGYPIGVKVDQNGYVYVTDKSGKVNKFDANGSFITRFGNVENLLDTEGLCITQNIVFVADGGRNRIVKYSLGGVYLGTFGTTNFDGSGLGVLNHPLDISTDQNGNFYVIDQSNKIKVFTPSGNFLMNYDGPGDIVWNPVSIIMDKNNRLFTLDGHIHIKSALTAPGVYTDVIAYSSGFPNFGVSTGKHVVIRRSATGYPVTVQDGVNVTPVGIDGNIGGLVEIDESSLSEGNYYYSIFSSQTLSDSFKYYSLPVTVNVLIDKTPLPAPTGFSNGLIVSRNTVELSWVNPSEVSGSGFSSIAISRKPGVLSDLNWSSTAPESEVSVTYNLKSKSSGHENGVPEGVYTYSIYARDKAGNYGFRAYKVVTVDVTPPVITGFAVSNVPPLRVIGLTWSGLTDGTAGVRSVTIARRTDHAPSYAELTDGGTTIVSHNLVIAQTSGEVTVLSGHENNVPDGHHYYSIFPKDFAGNINTTGIHRDVVVNGKPSAVTGFSATNKHGTSTMDFSWTNPSDSDLASITILRKRGGAAPTWADKGTDGVVIVTENLDVVTPVPDIVSGHENGLSDGTYSYSIFAQDSFGNMSEAASVTNVQVDTTSPASASGLTMVQHAVGSKVIDLSWTESPAADLAGMVIVRKLGSLPTNINDPAAVSFNITATQADNFVATSDTRITLDGIYYYSLFAKDAFGNISSALQGTVKLDTTAPAVPGNFSAATSYGGDGTVQMSWDADVDVDHYVVIGKSGSIAPVSISDGMPIPLDEHTLSYRGLDEGTYSFTVFAYDSYGNASSASVRSVTVDVTAPSAPATFTASNTSGTDSVALGWINPTDSLSGFGGVWIRRAAGDKAPSRIEEGESVVTNVSSTFFTDYGLSQGTYSYSIFARDKSGNTSAKRSATVYVDAAPSAPTPFTAVNTAGTRTVDFTWDNPDESDFSGVTLLRKAGSVAPTRNATDAVIVIDNLGAPSSGHDYGLSDGTYSYSLFAKDTAGNESSLVTVEGVQIDATAPSQPTGFTLSRSIGSKVVTLAWNSLPSDVTQITILRKAASAPSSISDSSADKFEIMGRALTSTEDTRLSTEDKLETTYYYTIYVRDSFGNISSPAQSSIRVDVTAPDGATSFTGSRGSGRNVNLTWDTLASDVDHSVLLRKKDSAPTSVLDTSATKFVLSGHALTSTTDTRLTADGTYFYQLYTYDSAGNVGAVAERKIVVDTVGISVPTGLSTEYALGTRLINLSWINPTDSNFKFITILRKSGSTAPLYSEKGNVGVDTVTENLDVFTPNPDITTGHETLSSDGTYSYSIFALDNVGNVSSLGTTSQHTFLLDTISPDVVTGYDISGASRSKTVRLVWTNPTDSGLASVVVLRKKDSGALSESDADVVVATRNYGAASASVFIDDTVPVDGRYYYTFIAKDGVGNESATRTSFWDVDSTAPNAPSLFTAQSVAASRNVALSWVNPTDVGSGLGFSSVVIRRSTSSFPTSISDGTLVASFNSGLASETATTSNIVSTDRTYYYSIFAKDVLGNVSVKSTAKVVVDTVAPAKPISLTATSTGSKVRLSWINGVDPSPGSGFAFVTVRRVTGNVSPRTIASGNFVASSSALQTIVDTNVPDNTYTYGVFAQDVKGNVSVSTTSVVVNGPTAAPGSVRAVATDHSVTVSWTNPRDSDFASITVRRAGGNIAPIKITNGQAVGSVITDPSVLSVTDTGLSDGTYSYTVFAKDTASNISSSTVTVKVDGSPNAPSFTTLTQVVAGLRKVRIGWTNPSDTDLASIILVRKTGSYASSVSDRSGLAVSFNVASTVVSPVTTTFDTRISSDGVYYYSLFAKDATGNISTAAQQVVTVDVTAPGQALFSSVTVTSKKVRLAWTGPTDSDMSSVKLVRRTDRYAATPTDGVVVIDQPDLTAGATAGIVTDNITTEAVYYYALFALDKTGNFASPDTQRVTVDVTVPGTASSFLATNRSGKTVNLSWVNPTDSLSGLGSVTIRRSTTAYPSTVTSGNSVASDRTAVAGAFDSLLDTVSEDGTYYYSVFAKDKNGNIGTKATAVVTVQVDPPSSPPSFTATLSGSSVVLNWTKPSDLDFESVTIRRANGSTAPVSQSSDSGVVAGNTGLTFTDTFLSDGTYSYSIFSKDSGGNYSSARSATVVVNNVPAKPSGISASVSGKLVTLSWVNPSDSDFKSVKILRKTTGFSTSSSDGDIVTDNAASGAFGATAATTNTVATDGTYYYSVFAKDTAGYVSEKAATVSVTVETGAPGTATSFSAINSSGKTVSFTWGKPVDVDFASMTIRRGIGFFPATETQGIAVASGLTGTTTTETPTSDGTYSYSIFAKDAAGNYSSAVTTLLQVESGAPNAPTNFVATSTKNVVTLSWKNSADLDFASVAIRRKTGTYPTSITDGVLVVSTINSTYLATVSTTDVVSSDGVYYYSIFARDASKNVSTKATTAINVDSTPPPKPTSLSASPSGMTVYLSWTNPVVSDFQSNKIVRRSDRFALTPTDGRLVATVIGSSTRVDTVTADATYYYSVFALDRVGNFSVPATKSALVDTTAPGAATGFITTQPLSDSKAVRLSWTNPLDLDLSFATIRRSTTGYPLTDSSGTLVTTNVKGLVATDNVSSDGGYYYSLFVKDKAGNVSPKTTSYIRVESGATSPATSFTAVALSKTVELGWINPKDLDFSSIKILRKTGDFATSESDVAAIVVTSSVSGVSYFDKVPVDETYYYSLFAKDVSDNASVSVTKSVMVDSTAPDAPTSITATHSVGSRDITLTWVNPTDPSPGSGFASVSVVRKTGSYSADISDGTVVSSNIVGTTLLTSVSTDGTYYFSIFPLDVMGNVGLAGQIISTVDTKAPGIASLNVSSTLGSRTISLSWVNPTDPSPGTGLSSVSIRRKTGSYPSTVRDGEGVVTDNTSTSYSDTVLTDNTYYYAIFAKDNAGNVGAANQKSIVIDTIAPSKPSGFSATQSRRTVTLSWTNPTDPSPGSGFASVSIRRSTTDYPDSIGSGEKVVSGSTRTSTLNIVPADNTYYYSIFAKDGVGNVSDVSTTSVVVDTTAPDAPSSFAAVASGHDVSLTWVNPTDSGVGFASVTVRRATSAYPSSISSGTAVTVDSTASALSDINLPDGTYYYSIFAKDLYGNTSVKATVNTTVETGPPSRPTSFAAVASGTSISLSWTNPTDLDFHSTLIQRSYSSYPTSINSDVLVTFNVKGTTFSDIPTSDGTYYYSIFARDITGNYSLKPATVNVVLEARNPGTPVSVVLSHSSGRTVNITWKNPNDIDFSSIFIRRKVGGFSSISTDGYLVTQNVKGLTVEDVPTSDGTYFYSVFAKDTHGNSSSKAGTANVVIETGPPAVPTGLYLTTSRNVITLHWVNPTDHDFGSIIIRRALLSAPKTPTSGWQVSQNALGVLYADRPTSDGTYFYSIFAQDTTGNINMSPVTASILLESGGPAAITNLRAVASGSDVLLTWTNPSDLDFRSVSIRRRTDRFPNNLDDVYAVADDLNRTSFTNYDLPDSRYYYSLFAIDTTGNVSSRATVTVDVDTVAPTKVTNLKAVVSGNVIVVTWKKSVSSDFQSITLVQKVNSAALTIGSGTILSSNNVSTTYNFTIPGDGNYFFSVFARDKAGNFAAAVTTSVLIDTTPPGSVTSPDATISGSTIYVIWTNPTDLDLGSVVVKRSLTSFPATPLEGRLIGTPSKIQSVSEVPTRDGVYHYSIFAKDTVGNVSVKATAVATFNIFAPDRPANATVNSVGNTVTLSWDAYTDFDFSHVAIVRHSESGNAATVNVTSASYVDTSVPDGTYTYYLYGVDDVGHIGLAKELLVVVDTIRPSAPTEFRASADVRSVILTWKNPTDLDFGSVSITRTTDPLDEDPFDREDVVTNFNGTRWVDEGLSDGRYYYHIIASDRTHNLSDTVSTNVLVDANPPNAPTGFTISRNGSTATLKWTNPSSELDFHSVTIKRTTDGFVRFVGDGTLVSFNVTTSSITDNTLIPGQTYYYSIFARDKMNNYSEAATAMVTYPIADITPPNPPKTFSATVSASSVRLGWVNPTANDFLSVRICRSDFEFPTLNEGIITQNVKGRTYTDLGLENATYYYSIFARDIEGNYSKAATLSVTVFVKDTTPPEKPDSVDVVVKGTTVLLSWRNPKDKDFTSVSIRRNPTQYPSKVDIGTVVTDNCIQTSILDSKLSQGAQFYSIFAKDKSGNYSKPTTFNVVIDTVPPGKVSTLSVTVIGNEVKATWINPKDSDFTRSIIRRLGTGYPRTVTSGVGVATLDRKLNAFTETGLADGVYYYGIFTQDGRGNTSKPVTFSVVADTAPPAAVSGFSVSATQNYTALLSWSRLTDGVDVVIRRSRSDYPTSINAAELVSRNVIATSWIDSDLTVGTYYYSIFSRDKNQNFSAAATQSVVITITAEEFQNGIKVDGGSIEVTEDSTSVITNPVIGSSAAAKVTVNAELRTQGLILGDRPGSLGVVVLESASSVIQEDGSLVVGKSGAGKIIQSSGVLRVLGTLSLGKEAGSSGNYVLKGGSLLADSIEIGGAGSGSIHWTGGTIEARSIVGNLQNNGGTLVVNSSAPLQITGGYSQDNSSKIQITLNSVNRAISRGRSNFESASSLINISGSVTMNGSIDVNLDGYSPRIGDVIRLLNKSTVAPRVTTLESDSRYSLQSSVSSLSLNLPELPDGQAWDTSEFSTYGIIRVLGSSGRLVETDPLNYPNPFKMGEGTRLTYFLNESADIELHIYLKTGKEAYHDTFSAGTEGGKVGQNNIILNTRIVGEEWPSGAYLYVLMHGGKVVAKGRFGVLPE